MLTEITMFIGYVLVILSVLFTVFHLYIRLHKSKSHISDEQLVTINKKKNFISVLVPTHAEPPAVVIQTIRSLMKQKYEHYEIIVIDNNTEDPLLWKPVEAFCKLNDKVSFHHYENVRGYKAGALNLIIDKVASQTDYVLTLDADYQLVKDGLSRINYWLNENLSIDLLQFPQAYRNNYSKAITTEYASFFDTILDNEKSSELCLSTGTLSCIKLDTLRKTGGWPTKTITEDAELGVKLIQQGYHTKFVNDKIGFGLIPEDYKALSAQRTRWIFGNIQVLKAGIERYGKRMFCKNCLAQLTAWMNFQGLTIAANVFFLSLYIFGLINSTGWLYAVTSSYILHIICQAIFFSHTAKRNDASLLNTLLINSNYLIAGATCWIPALFGREKPFIRTNKFRTSNNWSDLNYTFLGLNCINLVIALSQSILLAIPGLFLVAFLICSKLTYISEVLKLRTSTTQSQTQSNSIKLVRRFTLKKFALKAS